MLLYEAARKHARGIRSHSHVSPHGTHDLEAIAANLGATVEFRPLDPDVSGVVIKESGREAQIYINSDQALVRQRFTLAHEIGHLVDRAELADDDDYSFVDYRSQGKYDLHEFYADEFAGELLMPAEEFLDVVENSGQYAAAVHFGVSKPAVEMRLKRLRKSPLKGPKVG